MEIELMAYDQLTSRNYSDFYDEVEDSYHDINNCSLSKISKNPLLEGYHFICEQCKSIPKKITFTKTDTIRFYCKCKVSPKDILITKIKEYLINCDEDETLKILKCSKHSNIYYKYMYYCPSCDKQLCTQCLRYCDGHFDKLKPIIVDIIKEKVIGVLKQNRNFWIMRKIALIKKRELI